MASFIDQNQAEILGNGFWPDSTGNNVYDKRWLYETLMEMLKTVQEHANSEKNSEETNSSKLEESSIDIAEWDKDTEGICSDMPANSTVQEHANKEKKNEETNSSKLEESIDIAQWDKNTEDISTLLDMPPDSTVQEHANAEKTPKETYSSKLEENSVDIAEWNKNTEVICNFSDMPADSPVQEHGYAEKRPEEANSSKLEESSVDIAEWDKDTEIICTFSDKPADSTVQEHGYAEKRPEEANSSKLEESSVDIAEWDKDTEVICTFSDKPADSIAQEHANAGKNWEEVNSTILENIGELDKKILADACTLRDKSTNPAVAKILCECNIDDKFCNIIKHEKSPKLLKIVLEILGNVSSFAPLCKHISGNKDLVKAIIMLSDRSDSCTLVQVFRLLNCVVARKDGKGWYCVIAKNNSSFMENLKKILENELCHDVLEGSLQFLNRVLFDHPYYCTLWTAESYFMALIKSGKQLLEGNKDLDSFWSVLWNIHCNNADILCFEIYDDHFLDLIPLFEAFILEVGNKEMLREIVKHIPEIVFCGNILSFLGNLLLERHENSEDIKLKHKVLRTIVNIYRQLDLFLQQHMKNGKSVSLRKETEDDVNSIKLTEERNGTPKYFSGTTGSVPNGNIENAQAALKNIGYCLHCFSHVEMDDESRKILDELMQDEDMEIS